MDASDVERVFRWLQQPHVKKWWDDGDDSISKVEDHYFNASDHVVSNHVERYILLSEEGDPAGYFQYYALPNNVIGIDQFIGEESCINKGLGTSAVTLFSNLIIDACHPSSIVVDPDPANTRAIRCYEKAGFRFYKIEKLPGNKLAYMMMLSTAV